MKNNKTLAILVIFIALPTVSTAFASTGRGLGTAGVRTNPFRAQEPKQEDKKAEALKKYLEAQRLEKSGNLTAAIDAYKQAMELDPTSTELKVGLGSLYMKNRNFIDAETEAREALKQAPDSAEAEKLLASVLVAQTYVGTSVDKTKAEAAIKELENVVKGSVTAKVTYGNEDVPALAIIGEIYVRLGDNDKAKDAFKRLTETDSSSDRAFYVLATMYFQDNKFTEAAEAARKAYNIKQEPQYATLLAKCLVNTGQTQEALNLYKKALGIKDDSVNGGVTKDDSINAGITKDDDESGKSPLLNTTLVFDYARALVVAGHYDEAKKLMDPVIKGASKDSDAYLTATDIVVDALR
ncbi:MAG: tetratricopeptide repeat protein, partial [Blastocatellia bacterium]